MRACIVTVQFAQRSCRLHRLVSLLSRAVYKGVPFQTSKPAHSSARCCSFPAPKRREEREPVRNMTSSWARSGQPKRSLQTNEITLSPSRAYSGLVDGLICMRATDLIHGSSGNGKEYAAHANVPEPQTDMQQSLLHKLWMVNKLSAKLHWNINVLCD